jgi:hypothetical protein
MIVTATSGGAASLLNGRSPAAGPQPNCPRTTNFVAREPGEPGRPLKPQKLTELPPGIAFMAVYRHIGNCDAPLTMVEYRNPRRH